MVAPVMLDRTFDALANEHRRRIVDRLIDGPVDTPVLATHFEFSKQALNRHLHVLEEAGLIERRRRGRVHELALVADPLDGVADWVDRIRRGWHTGFDRLEKLLEETDGSTDGKADR